MIFNSPWFKGTLSRKWIWTFIMYSRLIRRKKFVSGWFETYFMTKVPKKYPFHVIVGSKKFHVSKTKVQNMVSCFQNLGPKRFHVSKTRVQKCFMFPKQGSKKVSCFHFEGPKKFRFQNLGPKMFHVSKTEVQKSFMFPHL